MSRYYSDGALNPATARAGDPLPPLRKAPNEVDVVRFCAAIRNFHRFHYDQAFMDAKGQGRIIVPGFMLGNWCIEAATRGIAAPASVCGLTFRNTRMAPIGGAFDMVGTLEDVTGEDLQCRVNVVAEDSGHVVTTATVRLQVTEQALRQPSPSIVAG